MNTIRSFSRFVLLPNKTKIAIIWIVCYYIKAIVIVKFFPLKSYFNKYFSLSQINHDLEFVNHNDKTRIISKVLKYFPRGSSCLIESLVVHLYFKRLKIYVPLHLGISIKHDLRAHAWYYNSPSHDYVKIN